MTNDITANFDDRTPVGPGVIGYCDVIHRLMTAQGAVVDLDELRLISGAAIQHYIYEPAFNRHEDEPRAVSPLALLFNNYGHFESLRYFTGWNVRDFDRLPVADLFRLAAHELQQGRALMTVDVDGSHQPAVITGVRPPRGLELLHRQIGGELVKSAIDLTGVGNLQRSEAFENFVVMVRPSEPGHEALAGPNRQRFELLRWIVKHHEADKEFFHETRENYAPGDRAWQRLLELVATAEDDEAPYLADHLEFLETGRESASRALSRWAESLGELRDEPALKQRLEDAAAAYGRVAEALAGEADITAARLAEVEAVAAIRESIAWFPGRFEPLD